MNLRREVSAALIDRGYSRDDRMHRLPIDGDRSWVVDTGPLDSKRAGIAPFVGVRHESLEKLTSELLNVPSNASSASVGANVGYVLGVGYKNYIPPTAMSIVMSAIDAAHDRLRQYLAVEDLPAIWKLTGVYDPGWRYRDVVIKLMTGRHSDIPRSLKDARAEFCEYEDEVCAQFRVFEENVRNQMAAPATSKS